jgi:hypothetical protein
VGEGGGGSFWENSTFMRICFVPVQNMCSELGDCLC